MPLSVDLLDQARLLTNLDPRRPKAASLRRAISTIYYALFHFLVEEATKSLLGVEHGRVHYRRSIARAFDHSTVKDVCTSFAGGTLKATMTKGFPKGFIIPKELQTFAQVFVDAQERRHLADYDLAERFTRRDVQTMIDQVSDAIGSLQSMKDIGLMQYFFVSLLAWKSISRR